MTRVVTAYHRLVPAAAPPPIGLPPLPTPLRQSLLLAALLHVWAVLVFGSAAGGSARPGEGAFGRVDSPLSVRLIGRWQRGADDAPVGAQVITGPAGQADTPRFGGAVRSPDDALQRHATPGAARLGHWQPRPGTVPAAAERAPAREAPAPPAVQPALPSPPAVAPRPPVDTAPMAATPPPAAAVDRAAPPATTVSAQPAPTAVVPIPVPSTAPALTALYLTSASFFGASPIGSM